MGKPVIWYEPVDVETYLDTADSTYTENTADGFDLDNLEDPDPSTTWRGTDIALVKLVFDFGSAIKTYGVYVANHNMEGDTPDTAFSWNAGTTNACADLSENITMPLTAPPHDEEYRPNSFVRMEAEKRYVGLFLDKASGSYTEAGYIFVPTKEYQFGKDFGKPGGQHLKHRIEAIKDEYKNSQTGFIDKTVHKVRNIFEFEFARQLDIETVRKCRKIQASDYVVFFPYGLSHEGYYGTIEFGEFIGEVMDGEIGTRWECSNVTFTEAVE